MCDLMEENGFTQNYILTNQFVILARSYKVFSWYLTGNLSVWEINKE